MKKIFLLLMFTALCFLFPIVYAEPALVIELSPEPQYNQVWAYETYLVNMSVQDLNLSLIDFSSYTGNPSALLFDGEIRWRGKGGYDFGEATTGYTYNLDDISIDLTAPLDDGSVLFNHTLEKDALDYGMNPFETVEVIFRFDVYIIMSDESQGPKIASKSRTLTLVDDVKVSYLEGKYVDMQDEINTVIEVSGLNSFNREKYRAILDSMNASLALGNYVEALDVWDEYDEDDRVELILGLIRASNEQYNKLESLQNVENQLQSIENQLSILEEEYEQLEITYAALANTYHKVNAELDDAKRNLTTSITAVFLMAIVFYFLGRRGVRREEEVE
jgi:hypothetical protein